MLSTLFSKQNEDIIFVDQLIESENFVHFGLESNVKTIFLDIFFLKRKTLFSYHLGPSLFTPSPLNRPQHVCVSKWQKIQVTVLLSNDAKSFE